jgi:hypothetical protein
LGCQKEKKVESHTLKSIKQRFWSKVKINNHDECWEWQSTIKKTGYGSFSIFIDGKWKKEGTHRVAYFLTTNDWPGDMLICHTCDNKKCCNPAHLWKGTYLDNNQDREKKRRGRYSKWRKNANMGDVTNSLGGNE